MSEHHEIYRAHFSDGEARGQVWGLRSKHDHLDFLLRGLGRDFLVDTRFYRLVWQDGNHLVYTSRNDFKPCWNYDHHWWSEMRNDFPDMEGRVDSIALEEFRKRESQMPILPPHWMWSVAVDQTGDCSRSYRCRPALGHVPDGQKSLVTLQESPPLAATPAGR